MTDADRLVEILGKLLDNIDQRQLDEADRLPLMAAVLGLRMLVVEGVTVVTKSGDSFDARAPANDVIGFLKTIMGSIATTKKIETDRLRAERALYATMRQTARNMITDLQKSKLDIYVDPTTSTPSDVMAAIETYSRERKELTQ